MQPGTSRSALVFYVSEEEQEERMDEGGEWDNSRCNAWRRMEDLEEWVLLEEPKCQELLYHLVR